MSTVEACVLSAVVGVGLGAWAFDDVGKGFLCAIGSAILVWLARRNPR